MTLNRWEDDALDFLPDSIVTPRRAILWDETAWHASLYARICQAKHKFAPHPSENHFFEAWKEFDKGGGATLWSGKATATPRPRLVWDTDGLAVRVPRVEGRMKLWKDEDPSPFRLRGGEDWALPQPWSTILRWQDREEKLSVLSEPEECAIFDQSNQDHFIFAS